MRIAILGCFLAGAALFAAKVSTAQPVVERISFAERSDGEGHVVRFHLDAPLNAYSEPRQIGENQVEVILFNASLSSRFHATQPEGLISAYSESKRGGHLVFRFETGSGASVSTSMYRDRTSNDILLAFAHDGGPGPPALAGDRASGSIPVKSTSLGEPRHGDRSGTQAPRPASAEGQRWMLDTIVIDAGHGGRDPGAVANGLREKDITLAVAHKLGAYIREHLGINVVFTREDDRFIELKERGRFANARGGKLFISLHVNSAANRRAHGTETYFLGTHRSDAARNTMERENSVIHLESNPDQYKNMDAESLIRMELTQSAYMRKSEELSSLIEQQFAERVGRTSRGVKQAGFYVLWGASMPAVLVELGFLTNRSEAAFLRSESGQSYMASAIFRAVREYKLQYEKGLSLLSND